MLEAGERTGKIVLWSLKQGGQILSEKFVPYVQAIDAYHGKGSISKTPIPKGSLGYYSRMASTIPQSASIFILLTTAYKLGTGKTQEIAAQAQESMYKVFQGEIFSDEGSTEVEVLTLCFIASLMLLWLTKIGDGIQERKIYTSKNNTNTK